MKKFQVITKEHCPRCDNLKKWLKEKNAEYEEWPIEKEDIKHKLLHDQKFIQNFCDVDGCMVYTPVIRLEDTGDYYFKEIFNQMGIRDKFVADLIGI